MLCCRELERDFDERWAQAGWSGVRGVVGGGSEWEIQRDCTDIVRALLRNGTLDGLFSGASQSNPGVSSDTAREGAEPARLSKKTTCRQFGHGLRGGVDDEGAGKEDTRMEEPPQDDAEKEGLDEKENEEQEQEDALTTAYTNPYTNPYPNPQGTVRPVRNLHDLLLDIHDPLTTPPQSEPAQAHPAQASPAPNTTSLPISPRPFLTAAALVCATRAHASRLWNATNIALWASDIPLPSPSLLPAPVAGGRGSPDLSRMTRTPRTRRRYSAPSVSEHCSSFILQPETEPPMDVAEPVWCWEGTGREVERARTPGKGSVSQPDLRRSRNLRGRWLGAREFGRWGVGGRGYVWVRVRRGEGESESDGEWW